MKKKFILILLGASYILLSSFANEPDKAEYKKVFIESCMTELTDIDTKIAKEYCNCAATQLVTDFTMDQLLELSEKMDNGEIAEDELELYLKPCIDQMSKQLEDALK